MISAISAVNEAICFDVKRAMENGMVGDFNEMVLRHVIVSNDNFRRLFDYMWCEVDRWDIVVKRKGHLAGIELKFYTESVAVYPSGLRTRKGGSGAANFKNLKQQLNKSCIAATFSDGSVLDEQIIWVFSQWSNEDGSHTGYRDYLGRADIRRNHNGISSTRNCIYIILSNGRIYSSLLIKMKIAQQVDSAEASTIAVPPSEPSGSPR